MKKIYLLFGIIMSLLLIGVVKAEEPFSLDFETPEKYSSTAALNASYKDGYITVDNTEIGSVITTYDKAGKKIKEKELEDKDIITINTKDDDIYIMYYDYDNGGSYLARLDSNLTSKKRVELVENVLMKIYNYGEHGMSFVKITEDSITIPASEEGSIVRNYSRDLTSYDEKTLEEDEIYDYFPDVRAFWLASIEFRNKSITRSYIAHSENYDAIGGTEVVCSYQTGKSNEELDSECYEPFVSLYNEKGNKKWTKDLSGDYTFLEEIKFIGDYVAVIATKENKSDILIYDLSGKLVQKVSSNRYLSRIIATEKGFIIAQNSCNIGSVRGSSYFDPFGPIPDRGSNPTSKVGEIGGVDIKVTKNYDPCCYGILGEGFTQVLLTSADTTLEIEACKSNHQVYYLYHRIEPKVTTGKGNIQVIDRQVPGEPVEFVITPDEGYVLGKVKVTDAKGKTVVFTSNRFTMPSADVTIEVEFLVANAETKDIAIIGVSIIAILAAAIVFTQYKKYKEVK